MKRIAFALALLLSAPAAVAWEAGIDGPLCTLTHTEGDTQMRLTYDPSVPLYTIAVSGPEAWPVSGQFSMTFDGPQPNTIRTDRHVLSPDLSTLSVSDRGFGNVLDGLQFNTTASATSGALSLRVSLEGAAPEVAAFRACGQVPSV